MQSLVHERSPGRMNCLRRLCRRRDRFEAEAAETGKNL
ncbi:hypothetical protein GJA_4276 [Janthinobacterium agaricidamnosum NBRC 102515 = DSM 9628]|uniref:Uncharacterized protein n=1 Tax=Janthinobacterium agaricidamnosum NBRC 102515 = DSM 9628 TaxID=1349767 RepID=W0V7S8_9BURK|nr:hypothetical protein GJA_4276 [Janthinobacterium agaricidamnosum NBRC 102515 = DSM 9628]